MHHRNHGFGFAQLQQPPQAFIPGLTHARPAAQKNRIAAGRAQHLAGDGFPYNLQITIIPAGRIEFHFRLALFRQTIDDHFRLIDANGLQILIQQNIEAQTVFVG